jgi:hypothetical protein
MYSPGTKRWDPKRKMGSSSFALPPSKWKYQPDPRWTRRPSSTGTPSSKCRTVHAAFRIFHPSRSRCPSDDSGALNS